MTFKRNFAITVLDPEKIKDINKTILEYAQITMQSSSHIYFDTQPINSNEIAQDITFFQIESEDPDSLDKKLRCLIDKLNQYNVDYGLRDEDTGEMLVFVKFVGSITIKFDNIKIIKEGTYQKIDELKSYKTELGTCKGYKPNFRHVESQPIADTDIKPETIYLFSHSQEDLLKFKDMLSEKIMKIDSNLKIEFIQFGGSKPEYSTKFNCLDLDKSELLLEEINKKNKKS